MYFFKTAALATFFAWSISIYPASACQVDSIPPLATSTTIRAEIVSMSSTNLTEKAFSGNAMLETPLVQVTVEDVATGAQQVLLVRDIAAQSIFVGGVLVPMQAATGSVLIDELAIGSVWDWTYVATANGDTVHDRNRVL